MKGFPLGLFGRTGGVWRAIPQRLGQWPAGRYWEPCGFTDTDVQAFLDRRPDCAPRMS